MAQKFNLQASVREKRASTVRREGFVPVVVYGHGITSKNIQVNAKEFHKVFSAAGSTSLVDVAVGDGSTHAVLIRQVQLHPLKGTALHADFYQVRLDEAIRAQVPLHFVGESSAVKDLGGVLVRSLDELELEALPRDLPHDIEVDISSLTDLEKTIHIRDLQLPPGVKLFHEPEEIVAVIQPPRSEAELEALTEEVKEEVEAVEGVKEEPKPEEGEAAAEQPAGPAETKKEKE